MIQTHLPRVAALASAFIVLLMVAAPRADDLLGLVEVPPPTLADLAASDRQLLENAMAQFERQRRLATGRALGLAYGRLGIHYQAHGQVSAAVASYQNAMTLDADNYRWPYFLALNYEAAGDTPRAIRLLRQSLTLNPDNGPGATRMGLALLNAGETDTGVALLTETVSQFPDIAAARAGLGRAALEGQAYAAAVAHYEAALALQPDAHELHGALADAYRGLGNTEQARDHAARAGAGRLRIDDPLVAFLQAHKQSSAYFVTLGERALDAGRPAQAAVFFDFAVAVNPDDSDAAARLKTLRSSQQTARATRDQATVSPQTPPQIRSGDADEYYARARYRELTNDGAGAIEDFRRTLELDAEQLGARLFLANALMRASDFAAAAVEYGKAAARDTANAEIRYRQGIAWLAAERCDRAEVALLLGHDLDRTAARIVQAIARLYATCKVDEAKRKSALRFAQLLYDARPSLETSETFAMVLAANGRFEEAADYQRQAIFEALKAGSAEHNTILKENLDRYLAGKPSLKPWPKTHPIYSPRPLRGDS